MPEPGSNKATCKKCGRTTFPTRAGNCFYCGKPLEDAAAVHAEPRTLGGQARFVPQADDRRHFLVLETGGHVELAPGQLFVIGRDPHASLVVNSPDVSRQHCEVDWEGDTKRPVLCEVRSRNGTFLNERLVARGQREPLRSGDTVRLGPGSVLRYFYATQRDFDGVLKELGGAQTEEFRVFLPTDEDRVQALEGAASRNASGRLQGLPAPGAAPAAAAAAAAQAPPPRVEEAMRLQGRLKDVSPAALLKWLHEQRLTGVLTFFDGQERGEAHMEEGRCVLASYGALSGREVIEKFVGLQEGGYRFRKASEERREKDPLPFPVRGRLVDHPGLELIAMIEQNGLSGELSITDGPDVSADAVFVDGVWTEARFGDILGKMAKHMVAGLKHGDYRFREADAPGRRATSEHEAVIAAVVDDAPEAPRLARDAARAAEARLDRLDPETQPMSAFDPSTPSGRDLVDPPTPTRPAPPRPTAPRPPEPSGPVERPATDRGGPSRRYDRRAGRRRRRPTDRRRRPPGADVGAAAAERPAARSTNKSAGPPLAAQARPATERTPVRSTDRQPVRDGEGRPAAPSPLRPPTGGLKERPLREERPPPREGIRPPLRTSGESARSKRQAPPPLPPGRAADDEEEA
ncbi:MAG: FHA domain-containing protein [Planctomycetes bacterium]|nr:FHA domain-containing protein [Planctomycetota bacterium]